MQDLHNVATVHGLRSKVTGKSEEFFSQKMSQPKSGRISKGIGFSKEVTFREAERSNYKHLEAMLFAPVTANSKLFSRVTKNVALKNNFETKHSLYRMWFLRICYFLVSMVVTRDGKAVLFLLLSSRNKRRSVLKTVCIV